MLYLRLISGRVLIFGAVLLLAGIFLPQAFAQEHLKITLTEQEYPPLISYDTQVGGLLTDMVRESFKLRGVDVVFAAVPNNRAITGLMQGLYDGSYGWTHSPERDAKLLYSAKPIYFLKIVFFQRSNEEFKWEHLTDLSPYNIGITQGNYYSSEFSALTASGKLKIDPAPSDISNFRKLLLGRIDLFPIDHDVGLYFLKNNFSVEEQRRIKFQNKAISIVPVYLVVRRTLPNAKEFITRFDQGFQQLSDSGQLERMIDAYKTQLATSTEVQAIKP
ncbi:substrate-binding periplasmic protein [Undibacterium sp. Ji67W]|uniref:substrate-binding periplasmic protein n=1 Tax=Undibacterium sp. Ji67W TaxID=3413042 RepID=UPI003BF2701F